MKDGPDLENLDHFARRDPCDYDPWIDFPAVMPGRQRLPNRRASETFALECAGLNYVATVSRFTNGRVAEISLINQKSGSAADNARTRRGDHVLDRPAVWRGHRHAAARALPRRPGPGERPARCGARPRCRSGRGCGMTHLHRNCRSDNGTLARASLAEIEVEIADVLDVLDLVQSGAEECGPVWQIVEAVRGLAWAVGSLARHHEDAAMKAATNDGSAG